MTQELHIYVSDRHEATKGRRDSRRRVMNELARGRMPTFEEMASSRGLVMRERQNSIFSDAWIPLAFLFLIIGFATSRNFLWLAIGGILLIIVAVSTWWKDNALIGVDYERQFDRTRVFPDEPIRLTLTVNNNKPLPLTWLQFNDRLPTTPAEEGKMAEVIGDTLGHYTLQNSFSISGYGQLTRHATLTFKKRGYYPVGPVTYKSGDLFTLFTIERDFDYRQNLVVYPKIWPLTELGFPAKEPFGELKIAHSLFTDPIKTRGIRDYHPQDRWRDVHWKATARRGSLQTKIYEPSTSMTMVVFLNVATFAQHWMGFDPDLLERAISVAGSIASYGTEQKWGVGLYVNGSVPQSDQPIRVAPGRDPEQLNHILEALAATTEFATGSIELLMQRQSPHLPWSAILVLVTASVTEEMAVGLLRLKEAGRRIVLISLADEHPPAMPNILTYHIPSDPTNTHNLTPAEAALALVGQDPEEE